jgi:hypothetical protein
MSILIFTSVSCLSLILSHFSSKYLMFYLSQDLCRITCTLMLFLTILLLTESPSITVSQSVCVWTVCAHIFYTYIILILLYYLYFKLDQHCLKLQILLSVASFSTYTPFEIKIWTIHSTVKSIYHDSWCISHSVFCTLTTQCHDVTVGMTSLGCVTVDHRCACRGLAARRYTWLAVSLSYPRSARYWQSHPVFLPLLSPVSFELIFILRVGPLTLLRSLYTIL